MQKQKSGWSVEYKYNKRNGQEEELVPGKSDHLSGETEFLPWFCKFNGFIKLQSANYNSSVNNKKIYIKTVYSMQCAEGRVQGAQECTGVQECWGC